MKEQQGQDPPQATSRTERVWQMARPALEMVALVAAYQQHEGLAVAAKALAVLGQSTVTWLVARTHR